MKKKYNSAQISVVEVHRNDIILTSGYRVSGGDRSADIETLDDNYESLGYTISW